MRPRWWSSGGPLWIALLLCGTGCASDSVVADAGESADAPPPALDAGDEADAAALEFPCTAELEAATAENPLEVIADVVTVTASGSAPVEGALVEALRLEDPDDAIGSRTTNSLGRATVLLSDDGRPVSAFLRITSSNESMRTDVFFPARVSERLSVTGVLLAPAIVGFLAQSVGAPQRADAGFALVLVVDCAEAPVQGATVSVESGDVFYVGADNLPDPALEATASSGLAYVFNAPAGAAVVSASARGVDFRPTAVTVIAGQVTSLGIAPGPQPAMERR